MDYMLKENRQKTQVINPAIARDTACVSDLRFARIMGPAAWMNLPKAVRARFSKALQGGESCLYRGQVTHTNISRAGHVLGNLMRLIGAPLPLVAGNAGAPAIVTVTEDGAGGGQFWTRQYGRAAGKAGFPQVIQSTKRFVGPTGLEEYIGPFTRFGIGMTLTLEPLDDGLLFKSDRYFLSFVGRRLYLPRAFNPGALTVGHYDKGLSASGKGQFDFTLKLEGRFLGLLVDQKVRFEDE